MPRRSLRSLFRDFRDGGGRIANDLSPRRQADRYRAIRARRRKLSGIGGWLALLVVVLCAISPTLTLVRQWRELYADSDWGVTGAAWRLLQARLWGVAIVGAAGTFALGALLVVRRRRSTVIAVVAGLWGLASFDILLRAAAVSAIIDTPYVELLAQSGYGQLRPFIFCTIWTAYLLRSKRVANTYPRPGSQVVTRLVAERDDLLQGPIPGGPLIGG